MKKFSLILKNEIKESITAKWFYLYSIVFIGAVIVLYVTGITESQVLGFMGLSRFLLTYIQLCLVVLPIFILITTVRSIVGGKESNAFEYMLSMPVSFRDFFWGKLIGRLSIVLAPVIVALILSVFVGLIKRLEIEWLILIKYSLLLISLSWFFLCLGMLISSIVDRQETGLAIAFFIWLVLILFLDFILIGVFLRYRINPELIITIALLNPLQDFRVASIMLFDPDMTLLGPAAWFILSLFGKTGFFLFTFFYPLIAGFILAVGGYVIFSRRDVV